MKRFAAITMVLILTFAMFTSAVAETKGFRFAKLNRNGAAYEETATKAGGSKYSADFYVTCLQSIKIDKTTYKSNLVAGDIVEFRVFDFYKNMITRDLAVCTYYGQTSKGYYQGNPDAGEAYYLAARMAKQSVSTDKDVVGRWTP